MFKFSNFKTFWKSQDKIIEKFKSIKTKISDFWEKLSEPSLYCILYQLFILIILIGASHLIVDKCISSIFDTHIFPLHYPSFHFFLYSFPTFYTGLSGLIFVFVVFFSIYRKEEEIRIFLNYSNVFPLLVMTILGLISFVFIEPEYLVLVFLYLSVSLLCVTFKAISLQMDREKQKVERLKLRNKKIKDLFIKFRTIQRKNEELNRKLKDRYINYSPIEREGYRSFKTYSDGVIRDINVSKLVGIIEELKNKKVTPPLQTESNLKTSQEFKFIKTARIDIFIHISEDQSINKEDPILSYKTNLFEVNEDEFFNFEKRINKTFSLENKNDLDFYVRKNLDIEKILQNIESSIREGNYLKFREHLEFYTDLIKHMLKAFSDKQDFLQALLAPQSLYFTASNPIREYLSKCFEMSMKLNDDRFLYDLRDASYKIIFHSWKENIQFAFIESLYLWFDQFKMLLKDKDKEQQASIWLGFFRNYFLTIIEKDDSLNLNFSIQLLEMIRNITKQIQKEETESLTKYFEKIINELGRVDDEYIGTQRPIHKSLQEEIITKEKSLLSRKAQFLMGIGAYLNSRLESNGNNFQNIILDKIKGYFLRYDFSYFINFYTVVLNTNNFWRWDFFIEIRDKKSAWFVQGKLYEYYLELANELVFCSNLDNLKKSEFKNLSSIEDLINKTIGLRDKEEKKYEQLNNFFSKVQIWIHEDKENKIINSNLDEEEITNLKKVFENNLNFLSRPRKLLSKNVYFKEECDKDMRTLGMNLVCEKEMFIKNDTNWSVLIESYSAGFAKAENEFFVNKLLKLKKSEEIPVEKVGNKLTTREWKDNEMILFINNDLFFNPKPQQKINLNDKTVSYSRFYTKSKDRMIIILDVNKLPKLKFCNPIENDQIIEMNRMEETNVYFGVEAYSTNSELKDDLKRQNPEWLQKKTKEECERFFILNANLKLVEKLNIEFNEKSKNCVLDIYKLC